MARSFSRAEVEAEARARGITEDEIRRVLDNVAKLAAKGVLHVNKAGDMRLTEAGKKEVAAMKAAGIIQTKR